MNKKNIDYNSSVEPYLPIEIKEKFNNLSFANVLFNTTGYPEFIFNTVKQESKDVDFNVNALRFLSDSGLSSVFSPNEFVIESNVNAILAGVLIESISGNKFEEYMNDVFYKSLGMDRTSVMPNLNGDQNITKRYNVVGGRKNEAGGFYPRFTAYNSIITCQEDINKFLEYLTSSKIAKDMIENRNRMRPLSSLNGDVFVLDGLALSSKCRIFVIPSLNIAGFVYYNSGSDKALDEMMQVLLDSYVENAGNYRCYTKYLDLDKERLSLFESNYYPLSNSNSTIEKILRFFNSLKVSEISGGLLIDSRHFMPIADNVFFCKSTQEIAEFRVGKSGRLNYLIIGNEIYNRSSVIGFSGFVYLSFTLFFIFIIILFIIVCKRWSILFLDRVEDRPRGFLLVYLIYSLILIALSYLSLKESSYWNLAYGYTIFQILLKWIGWGAPIAFLTLTVIVVKTSKDYKWQGILAFLMRASMPLNLFIIYFLYKYNFILNF